MSARLPIVVGKRKRQAVRRLRQERSGWARQCGWVTVGWRGKSPVLVRGSVYMAAAT